MLYKNKFGNKSINAFLQNTKNLITEMLSRIFIFLIQIKLLGITRNTENGQSFSKKNIFLMLFCSINFHIESLLVGNEINIYTRILLYLVYQN